MTPSRGRSHITRWLPIVSVVWLLSLLIAAPLAQRDATRARADAAHQDLSLFAHSDTCIACHNNLTTAQGEDVSIGSMWRATIMANSARDPYWQASVRRETIDHPEHAAAIEDECASCHMPMPQRIAKAAGAKGQVFAHLPFGQDDAPLGRLGADSVSCTVCHQIAPDRLGTAESFNANFVLRPTPAEGARAIFGPYNIDAGRRTIMRSVSGFVQEEATHLKQSELCASCHTLITTALGPGGAAVGELHEQANYQEWRHSDFSKEDRSCQSCHMPRAAGPVRIASVLGDARDSLARHVFVGGNAFMLRLLNRYRDELGVTALPAELEATAQATIRQLQQDTADLAIPALTREGTRLSFDIEVKNLAGHKFPTGYPSRRAWLHVRVADASGRVVFESGRMDDSGRIAGNANDADALAYEPHYAEITDAGQVQIYESVLGTPAGDVTTGLLSATRYLKDNRLLPRGFDKATAGAEIAVYGDAAADDDFRSGGDRVRYRVPVSGDAPYRVTAELLYQPIGFRWATNLEPYTQSEPQRFVAYYRSAAAASSVVVAASTAP